MFVCRIFAKYVGKTNVMESFYREAARKLKELLFSDTLFACLSSVWFKGYFYFLTRISKGRNLCGKKVSKIKMAYLVPCEILTF